MTANDTTEPRTFIEAATRPRDRSSLPSPPDIGEQSSPLPPEPVRKWPGGIRMDFLYGCRIKFPDEGGPWHVLIGDADTGVMLHDTVCGAGQLFMSDKKYYVRFDVVITDIWSGETVLRYVLDLSGEVVLIHMPAPPLGDTLAWLPYADAFRERHGCRCTAVICEKYVPLFEKQYPWLALITPEQMRQTEPFACYSIHIYWNLPWEEQLDHMPMDHRAIGLHRMAAVMLGLDPEQELRPKLDLSAPRKIAEPYVCIAVQSTTMSKNWTFPEGWIHVVEWLKAQGYRVLCVDQRRCETGGIVSNYIPWGCEDFTGDLPLQERVDLIKDADMFIGLASGLSWLAWGCGVPVVLIGGFSLPFTEFYTPYRVINRHACCGCWNDPRYTFDKLDWTWCPHFKDTDRQHECMRLITPKMVIETIERVRRENGDEDIDARVHGVGA